MKKLTLIILMLVQITTFAQSVVYFENFDGTSQAVTSSGTPGWAITPSFYLSGTKCDSATIINPGDSSALRTNSFSTLGKSSVMLEFDHICKIEFNDKATIHISVDNGVTWTQLTENEYLGNGTLTHSTGNKFTAASYISTWMPMSLTTPANNWWKHETFDISAIAGNKSNVMVSFNLEEVNGTNSLNYAWLLDDIKVTTSVSELIPPSITFINTPNPVIYNSGPIEIRAQITDASGISSAKIIYTSNNGSPDTVIMVYYTNNIYVGFINSTATTSNDTICYYITANDNSPNHNIANNPGLSCNQFIVKPYPLPFCDTTISSFPYIETFAGFPIGPRYGCSNSIPLANKWVNATGDSIDWIPYKGSLGKVGSNIVGPQADHTTGDTITGRYLFLENSGCNDKWAYLESPCFNISLLPKPTLKFWYMRAWSIYGSSNCPWLVTQIYYNGQWNTLDSTGSYTPNLWNEKTFDLSNYKNIVKLRFKGKTASNTSVYVDVAIDDISIFNDSTVAPPVINDAGISAIESPVGGAISGNHAVKARLKNFGSNILNNVGIVWEVNGVIQDTLNWTTPLYSYGDSLATLGIYNFAAGSNIIKVWTINPNQVQDVNTTNDLTQLNLFMCNGVLSGNYTINASMPASNTNYTSLSEFAGIVSYCGLNGPVVVNIANGSYNENIMLGAIPGSSSTNTITFRSASNNADSVTINKVNNQSKVTFSGASYITFENITFNNIPINFEGTSNSNISFKSNIFSGSSISSANTSTDTDILIDSSSFISCSINLNAPSNARNVGYTISNSTFKDIPSNSYMIRAVYTNSINIFNNILDTNSTTIPKQGVYLSNCQGVQILKNRIVCTQYGIYANAVNRLGAVNNLIANNFIIVKGSGEAYGMYFKAPKRNDVFHNSVCVLNTNSASAAFYYQKTGNNQYLVVKNNIFVNKGGGYAYRIVTPDFTRFTSDYNNLYTTGSVCVLKDAVSYPTLSNWKSANSPQDAYSITTDVVFNSTTDLHSNDLVINGEGVPLSSVSDDIDGDTRSSTAPCLGADEFSLPSVDIGVTQIIRPFAVDSSSIARPVIVDIKNFGTTNLFTFDVKYQVNNGTPVSTTINDTLLSNQTKQFNLANLNIPSGNNTITVYTSALNDGNNNNDTAILSFFGVYPNDAEVKILYTLGKLPLNSGAQHQVKAVIENKGYNPILNLPVTLNSSGANSFANIYTIDTLHYGETKTISFAPFSPLSTGVNNVKVSIPTDNDILNNEFNFRQEVTTDTFSYADTSAILSDYGISTGMILNKYYINGSKVIDKVNAYITGNNTIGSVVYGVVLDINGNILATSANDTISTTDTSSMMSFNVFNPTQTISNSDFYAGIAVVNSSLNIVGVQAENPVRNGSFFRLNSLTNGLPLDIVNQVGGRLLIEAVVTTPVAIDAAIGSILSPNSGCGLGNETITIEIQNAGVDTIKGGLTASYQLTGQTVVSQIINDTILPNGIKVFSFPNTANLAVTSDTIFELKAWVSLTGDNSHANDTSDYFYIVSKYTAGVPSGIPATISYGQTAQLGATPSSPAGVIKWYTNATGGYPIGMGNSFTTPPLFDTTTYYIEAANMSPVDLKITEVSLLNNGIGQTVNYPSYLYSTANSTDFVEITNMGYSQANLSGYKFKIYDPSSVSNVSTYTFANGVTLDPGAVMVLDVRSSGADKPQFNYYLLHFNVNIQPAHSQALALYKPNGAIIDALVIGNDIFTDSTSITGFNWNGVLAPTIGVAGYYRNFSDYNTANDWTCSAITDPLTIGTLNPALGLPGVAGACSPNQRVTVLAYVQNIPNNESGITQIVAPSGNLQGGTPYNIEVKIKNYGLSNLTSATINWSVNGNLQTPYGWSGNLPKDSSVSAIIGSYTFSGGSYLIKSWTSLPNGVQDPYTVNDTASTVVTSCMSGIITIGSNGDFQTLDAAVQMMSLQGICGPVIFEVANGIYNTNTINIKEVNGCSSTNTITFRSASGNHNNVLIQTTQDDLFKLDSSMTDRYFRFENLSFKNSPVSSSGTRIINMLNSSNVVFVKGCRLEGSNLYSSGLVGKHSMIYSMLGAKDSLVLDSNIFVNGGVAVEFSVNNSAANCILTYLKKAVIARNNTFTGNRVAFLIYNTKNVIIKNNSISGFAVNNRIIDMTTCYSNVPGGIHFDISSNYISNIGSEYSIFITGPYSGTSSNPNVIANNMIISGNKGIHISRSGYVNILNNTVNIEGTSSSNCICLNLGNTSPSLQDVNIFNNIFTMKGNSGYCMAISDNSPNIGYSINNNNYYSADSSRLISAGWGSYNIYCSNLFNWQSAFPSDSNSISHDVQYTSATDLHTADGSVNNKGVPISSITHDIDGDVRDLLHPDIGADEFDLPPIDLSVTAFVLPDYNFKINGTDIYVAVEVKNLGGDTVKNFNASYIYANDTITQSFLINLPNMQKDTIYFTVSHLTVASLNQLKVYVQLTGDTINKNDTISKNVTGLSVITSSYTDDFEGSISFVQDGNSEWELGMPTAGVINTAYSPVNVWATNLSGFTSIGTNYLYSPYFIFPASSDTVIMKFKSFMNVLSTNNTSGGYIEYKKGNALWQTLGYMGDTAGTNWYNKILVNGYSIWSQNNASWTNKEYRFSPSIWNTGDTIQFRFVYTEYLNTSNNDGWAIDDFTILRATDLGVISIDYPMNDTAAFSLITAKVSVKNFGTSPKANVPVNLSLNGNLIVTDNISSVIAPGNTYQHTFSIPYTVPLSNYYLCAYTDLSSDVSHYNDTLCKNYGVPPLANNPGINAILSPNNFDTICVNPTYYNYVVKARIKNYGSNTLTTIPVEYKVNNGSLVQETWSGSLGPGDSTDYMFTAAWIPQIFGNIELCARTRLVGDLDTVNDESCKSLFGVFCTSIENIEKNGFILEQNVPNPTTGMTSIIVAVPNSGDLRFVVMNQFGILISDEYFKVNDGINRIHKNFNELSSGVYFYFAEFESKRLVKKMVIIRE